MEIITKLFDIDFASFVPKLPVLLGFIRGFLVLALLAGPIAMVVLGGIYLYKPTPEANYKFGFRTYFGMGSVEAWQFSQRMAGLVYGILGIALTVIMLIVMLFFIGKDLMQIAGICLVVLLIQAVLILAARFVVAFLAGKYFDKDGNRRK